MLRSRTLLVLILIFLAAPSLASAGYINLLLGQRQMNEEWEPVDDQPLIGANLAVFDWPVHLEFGFSYSTADGTIENPFSSVRTDKAELALWEFSFGVVKVWREQKMTQPYLGVGVSYLGARVDALPNGIAVSDTESTTAGYAHGGVFWRFAKQFNLGVDLRYLGGGEVGFEGTDLDLEYMQAALILGWSWN